MTAFLSLFLARTLVSRPVVSRHLVVSLVPPLATSDPLSGLVRQLLAIGDLERDQVLLKLLHTLLHTCNQKSITPVDVVARHIVKKSTHRPPTTPLQSDGHMHPQRVQHVGMSCGVLREKRQATSATAKTTRDCGTSVTAAAQEQTTRTNLRHFWTRRVGDEPLAFQFRLSLKLAVQRHSRDSSVFVGSLGSRVLLIRVSVVCALEVKLARADQQYSDVARVSGCHMNQLCPLRWQQCRRQLADMTTHRTP